MITDIGYTLRLLRLKANHSQTDLANILGCTCQMVSLIEKGKRVITLDCIERLRKAYNLTNEEVKDFRIWSMRVSNWKPFGKDIVNLISDEEFKTIYKKIEESGGFDDK